MLKDPNDQRAIEIEKHPIYPCEDFILQVFHFRQLNLTISILLPAEPTCQPIFPSSSSSSLPALHIATNNISAPVWNSAARSTSSRPSSASTYSCSSPSTLRSARCRWLLCDSLCLLTCHDLSTCNTAHIFFASRPSSPPRLTSLFAHPPPPLLHSVVVLSQCLLATSMPTKSTLPSSSSVTPSRSSGATPTYAALLLAFSVEYTLLQDLISSCHGILTPLLPPHPHSTLCRLQCRSGRFPSCLLHGLPLLQLRLREARGDGGGEQALQNHGNK